MGDNNDRQVVQTQTNNQEPWSAAQPFLKDVIGQGQSAFGDGDFRMDPYPESTVVDYSAPTQQAMGRMQALGEQGSPIFGNAIGAANDIIVGNGMQAGQQGAADTFGRVSQGGYRPESAMGIRGMMDTASGAYMNSNPFLDQVISDTGNDIREQLDESFGSAGRYGSGAHAGAVVDQVGQMASQLRYGDHGQERANMIGAQSQLVGAGQGQDQIAMGGASGLNDLYRGATADMLGAAQMAPNLFAAQTMPDDMLMQVGNMQEDLSGRQLQDKINRHNQSQSARFDELSRAMALAGGAGQMGGTSSGQVLAPDQSPSTFERLLGGGLMGASMLAGF
ncbi:MAG: hypothetical protein ACE37E_01230 [Hyphomicrobiales bacterium]